MSFWDKLLKRFLELDHDIRFEGKRQVICWIENHFKKIDNYIEN